jgi:hypothetical protein
MLINRKGYEHQVQNGTQSTPPSLVQHEKFQSAPGSRVGTPAYLAPEVILTTRGKTYDGKVGGGAVAGRWLGVRLA